MKKNRINTILSFFVSVVLILALGGCTPKNAIYSADGYYLDTYVSVTLYGCGSDEIAKEAIELCDYYEKIFDRTDTTSLVGTLNSGGEVDETIEEYKHLVELTGVGKEYGRLTGGALDITIEPVAELWDFKAGRVPTEKEIAEALGQVDYTKIEFDGEKLCIPDNFKLELGAVAKGYIADRIKDFLIKKGVDSGIINLGGNILCIGNRKPDGNNFTVGVQKPFGRSDDILLALSVDDKSVVTSGVYERYFYQDDVFYHHILDTATGYPVDNDLWAVTVISEESVVGDCLSTGLFVMGKDRGLKLVNSLDGVEAIFVDSACNVFYSDGAKSYIVQ